MRILFCNYEYPPLGGGGGVINAQLAQELAKKHEITVLTSQGLDLPSSQVENGVNIIRVPVLFRSKQAVANLPSMLGYVISGIREGHRLIKTQPFDIINTHFVVPSGPVGNSLSNAGNIPNVLSLHGGDIFDPSKALSPHRHLPLRIWIRRLLRSADRIVGQSRNTIANMQKYYIPDMEASLIPLGIPRIHAEPVPRDKYGLSDDDIVFVTVGRLVARKNITQLIELMARLKAEPVKLLIMGSGPQEKLLKEETERLQVTDRVLFLGFVEEQEKLDILKMSDVFVSTSLHEGFGLVFLEAMACGLPVVCYSHGGQTDFLENEVTGFVPELQDLNSFEVACKRLIRDHDLRRTMGKNNQDRVENYYIDTCASRYESLFEDVIATHQSRSRSYHAGSAVAK